MDNLYQIEGGYLVATPRISNEALREALVYIYQIDEDLVSGIVMNKPFTPSKTVGDFLAYPKHFSERPVWQGGPVSKDRLIAFCQNDKDIYITDRLTHLTPQQIDHSMIFVGQCVWDSQTLSNQIRQGHWVLVGSDDMIPDHIPAEERINFVLGTAGVDLNRYVALAPEVV